MIKKNKGFKQIALEIKNMERESIDNTKELEDIFSEDINGRVSNDTFEKSVDL